MLKKIKVHDLCKGMFIEKFEGSWLKHPFWRTSFKLVDPEDIKTIKESGISHVWIDASKGLDVQPAEQPAKTSSIEMVEPQAETVPEESNQVPLEEEIEVARETLIKAKQAVVDMFQDARMGNSVKLDDAEYLVDEIAQSVTRNSSAMLSISRMKTKDDYTYMHSVAVCALMISLGKQLGYQGDMHSLGMAGLLHDVGKMHIPDEVLNKPGKLTDEEFELVKSHPLRGWETLKQTDNIDDIALDVCLHHHERVDGKGYPDNLSGDDFSLVARMAAVCDVYDAVTSDRCYKKGWEPAVALKRMAEWKGHFDDTVFKSFVKTVGIYPAGTLLKLQSGRLGIVTEQSEETLLKPKIKLFYSTNSKSPIPQKIIDLTRSQEVVQSIEEPEAWGISAEKIMQLLIGS